MLHAVLTALYCVATGLSVVTLALKSHVARLRTLARTQLGAPDTVFAEDRIER